MTAPAFPFKVLGLAGLVAYLAGHPPFVDAEGIVAYLASTLIVGAIAEFAIAPAAQRFGAMPPNAGAPRRADGIPAPLSLRNALLALGEDGLTFVPLLLAGSNPVLAEVVAMAVASLHFPRHGLRHCIWKGLHVFVVAMVVLPYGLASLALGHLIALAVAHRFGLRGVLQPLVSPASSGRTDLEPRHEPLR